MKIGGDTVIAATTLNGGIVGYAPGWSPLYARPVLNFAFQILKAWRGRRPNRRAPQPIVRFRSIAQRLTDARAQPTVPPIRVGTPIKIIPLLTRRFFSICQMLNGTAPAFGSPRVKIFIAKRAHCCSSPISIGRKPSVYKMTAILRSLAYLQPSPL